jgi:hypothetical protein
MVLSPFIFVVPLIVYRGRKGQGQLKDAAIRSIFSFIVGVVGYWLPLLWADAIERPFPGEDFDDRLGFYFMWTLPIILVHAIFATISQVRACLEKPGFRRWGRIVIFVVAALLCWSPFVNFGCNFLK